MTGILTAAGILGGLGLIFGLVLGLASKIFEVHKDERIVKIMEILPCANCGGCGFAGCSAFAQAVVDGRAPVAACSVGGEACAADVSQIMGVESVFVRKAAHVKCAGTYKSAPLRYSFAGLDSCAAAARLGGGPKSCAYGCMGLGSCVEVCEYGALCIEDGIAKVDKVLCTACGRCVEACPKRLIEVLPTEVAYVISCKSKDKGAEMKAICTAGCIGCRLCEKACDFDAVHVEDNLAVIDPEKCTVCGACAEKCPKKVIHID